MRFTPVDELTEAPDQATTITLGFPFRSVRTATASDPSWHRRRDAGDLFVLALQRLSARLGHPDFPDMERETPAALRRGDGPLAIWDFDYQVVILEVVAGSTDAALFQVTLRCEG